MPATTPSYVLDHCLMLGALFHVRLFVLIFIATGLATAISKFALAQFKRLLRRPVRQRKTVVRFLFPGIHVHHDAETMCTVCLSKGTDSMLECGHMFHWKCVGRWLSTQNTCPLCRRKQKCVFISS